MKVIPSFYIKLHILPYTITTEYVEIKNTADYIIDNFKIKNGRVVLPKPKTNPLIKHIENNINKIIKNTVILISYHPQILLIFLKK